MLDLLFAHICDRHACHHGDLPSELCVPGGHHDVPSDLADHLAGRLAARPSGPLAGHLGESRGARLAGRLCAHLDDLPGVPLDDLPVGPPGGRLVALVCHPGALRDGLHAAPPYGRLVAQVFCHGRHGHGRDGPARPGASPGATPSPYSASPLSRLQCELPSQPGMAPKPRQAPRMQRPLWQGAWRPLPKRIPGRPSVGRPCDRAL
mmetsp:Transcript_114099/g.271610  ORF Transcript_114099/g.271610 Transcript_114099/m.271610 type:complete len:206 (-) Transcript_114099:596-1213(-)